MPRPTSDRLALLRALLAEKGLAGPASAPIPPRPAGAPVPLSSAQERLFFLELYEPGTALHNDALLFTIDGPLEPARLRDAVGVVQQRHEILRTTFALGPEGPRQIVGAAGEPPFQRSDLRLETDPARRAGELAREEARRPFDLERAPPWRVRLLQLGEEEWQLVLTMHHLLTDGASMGLFCDELSAAYAGSIRAPLAVQFGDYACWERAQLDEPRAAADLAYWKRVLAAPLPAFAWQGSVGRAGQEGASIPVHLGRETLLRLRALARAQGVTTNQVLLGAWLVLLGAAGECADVRSGLAVSLRNRRELEPLLGFFVQSLVLRTELEGETALPTFLARLRAQTLEAQQHAGLPFDRVVRALARPAGTRGEGTPLLQAFFSHMKDAIRAPTFAGTHGGWRFLDPGVARFELALVLHESDGEVTGFLEYSIGLFDPASAARLACTYTRLVGVLLERPTMRLAELRAACGLGTGPARRAQRELPARLRRAAGGGA